LGPLARNFHYGLRPEEATCYSPVFPPTRWTYSPLRGGFLTSAVSHHPIRIKRYYSELGAYKSSASVILTMESRAHRRRDYSPAGRMSRTERDLSNCSQGSDSSVDSGTSPMLRRAMPRSRSPNVRRTLHVCVVGAGFAGLRCAEVLVNRGIKVTILEGRDRLGGRVCSSTNTADKCTKNYRSTKVIVLDI